MSFFIEYFNSIVGALAAIGAVASIYYLIQEMREQNRVARANARQNVADSHQEIALEGMKKSMVKIKLKLRNDEELTPEEDAKYMSYFSIMLRSRENQHYQYTIGMIDKGEWENYKRSFKTLFKEPKHLEIWEYIKITFSEDFVELVDEQIRQSQIYGQDSA